MWIQISGADIAVYDPPSEGNEAMIVVSGPPDQAESAQRMLVELILQGQWWADGATASRPLRCLLGAIANVDVKQ